MGASRNVSRTADFLIVHRYLCVNGDGITRLVSEPPRLGPSEIAIRIQLKLPRALFTRPLLNAEIEIPAAAVTPTKIETEVVNGIAKAIKDATGLAAHLTVGYREDKA